MRCGFRVESSRTARARASPAQAARSRGDTRNIAAGPVVPLDRPTVPSPGRETLKSLAPAARGARARAAAR